MRHAQVSFHCVAQAKFWKSTSNSITKRMLKIISSNSARYKQQALAEREIPDCLDSPASTMPPVPKVATRLQKQAERVAKQWAKAKPKLLSRGRGRERGLRGGRGRAWSKPKIVDSIPKHRSQKTENLSKEKATSTREAKARATGKISYESWRQESFLSYTMFN